MKKNPTIRSRVLKRAAVGALALSGIAAGVAGVAGATTTTAPAGHTSTAPSTSGPGRQPPQPVGKVTAVDATSLTITDPGGHSHTITLTSATTYTKDGAAATAADVTVGEDVVIDPVKPTAPVAGQAPPKGPPAAGSAPPALTASVVNVVATLPSAPAGGTPPSGTPPKGGQPPTGTPPAGAPPAV